MKRTPLNLPKTDERLDAVSFVKEYSPHRLKILVSKIWKNLQDLANALDDARPDIAGIIDSILDGGKWKETQVDERIHYGHYKGFIVRWDSRNREFTLLDENYKPLEAPLRGVPRSFLLAEMLKKVKK